MWFAILNDGNTVSEGGKPWEEIKDDVVALGFAVDSYIHWLPSGMPEYMQATTACAVVGGEAEINSRWIGCATPDGTVMRMRFFESKPEMILEVSCGGQADHGEDEPA